MNILLQRVYVTVANLNKSVPSPNPAERLSAISDKMTWIVCVNRQIAEKLKRILKHVSILWKDHLPAALVMDINTPDGEGCGEFKSRNT